MFEVKKIRVLECIRQGSLGGAEMHVLDLLNRIDRTKFEPVVLSLTDGPILQAMHEIGIATFVVPTGSRLNLFIWRKIKNIIVEQKIDIVHAHGTRAAANTFLTAKLLKKPMVYTIHGWSFHQNQQYFVRWIREFTEKILTGIATVNIAVSESNRRDGQKRFNLKHSILIYNGISREKYNPDLPGGEVRKLLNIPVNKTLVGFFVRMTLQKDPFTLIRAMRLVCDATDNVALLMVGEGNLKKDCIKLCESLKITSNVYFDGFRQDIPDLLRAIDIYCLPSLWEGLPLGLLEAMAMRKACIATPVDGTKEIIVDGENGLLVPYQNAEKLAEAILRLHKEKSLRNYLASNGYYTIQSKFDVAKMTTAVEDIYRQLMENKTGVQYK